jgi:hypothetical protein
MCTRAFCFFNFLSTVNELITLKIKEILNCRPMMFWSFHYGFFFVITRFVYRLFSYLTNINIIKKSVRWFHCTHQCVGACVTTFELYLLPLHDAVTRVTNELLVWRQQPFFSSLLSLISVHVLRFFITICFI